MVSTLAANEHHRPDPEPAPRASASCGDLLNLADRRIAEASAGHGHLLLLAGEAGIGKTRLLRAILAKAEAAGFRLAKGDLAPQDRQVPLASVLDLARTMNDLGGFDGLGDALFDDPGWRWRRLAGIATDPRTRRRQLIITAIDRPTLLAFEDLQWADELSLEVVGEFARIGQDRPLLLLGAYRADELPLSSLHREWRARLLSQRLAEEARLQPLTYDETALVTTLILGTGLPAPRAVVNAVYERTDGIPLHVEELLGASATRRGPTATRPQRRGAGHDRGRDPARLARLSDQAQAVALAGAVMGRCFSPEVLAGVMDRPIENLDDPSTSSSASSFLYPFQSVDKGASTSATSSCGTRCTSRSGSTAPAPARAGRGVRPAPDRGDRSPRVCPFRACRVEVPCIRSGGRRRSRASAVSSRREAFELYGRAVANIPDGRSADELGDLYAAYGEAAGAVDDVPAGIAAAEAARRHFLEAGRPVDAADQLIGHSIMIRRDVQPMAERQHYLDQASAELNAMPVSADRGHALSDVLMMRAMLLLDVGRLDDADAAIVEGRAQRRASGDTDTGDLDFVGASIDVVRGRTSEGIERMMDVTRGAREARRESTGVTSYRVAAAFAMRVMDYERAEVCLREGLRYADEIQQSYCRHVMAATSAHIAWAAGRWDEAIPIAEIEIVERGSRRGTLGSRDALGYVCLGRGDLERARSVLEASLAIGRATDEVDLVMPPLWGLAEVALLRGDAETAAAHCESAFAVATAGMERAHLVPFAVTGVRAYQAAAPSGVGGAMGWSACARHLADWAACGTRAWPTWTA